jgi:DNA-binding HxlR family transcriptional regulator
MRSYGEYCSVAKALDVLGERWTLLIVRELLTRGPCRYTDLRTGLPGIASNLLADRVRDLEAAGVVEREEAPPPVATTLYSLTERGKALEHVISELARWGAPLMRDSPPDDEFRGQWLQFPVRMFLADNDPKRPASTVEIHAGDQSVVVKAANGEVSMRLGGDPAAAAVITASPQQILALMSGKVTLGQAVKRGLRVDGSRAAVERILPDRTDP